MTLCNLNILGLDMVKIHTGLISETKTYVDLNFTFTALLHSFLHKLIRSATTEKPTGKKIAATIVVLAWAGPSNGLSKAQALGLRSGLGYWAVANRKPCEAVFEVPVRSCSSSSCKVDFMPSNVTCWRIHTRQSAILSFYLQRFS